jgi:hypothetical protein
MKPIQILQSLFGIVELYHTVAKVYFLIRALYEYHVSCFVFKVMKNMVHSILILGRLTHLHRTRALVENQLG